MPRVTVLGSGDAFSSGGRAFSGYLVEGSGAPFLIDCGPSTLQGLKKRGLDPGQLDFVLISHLHGDHFGGVPFLLMEYIFESPRTRPFAIHGPLDTERRVKAVFSGLYERIAGEPLPFPVRYHQVTAGVSFTVGGVRVVPVAVPHASEMPCFAYRVEVDGRVIFYSGDTGWTEDLVTHARGADLFLCECQRHETWFPMHLSYPEIAARARDFGCRRLVLTHLGHEPLARRAELSLECAEDGMTIEL